MWTPATPGATVELALRTGHHTAPPVTVILCRAPDEQGHILVRKELLVAMGFQTGVGLFQHTSQIERVSRAIVATPKGPLGIVTRARGGLALAAPLAPEAER